MADLPAGAHHCATCPRPIWGKVERCGACRANNSPLSAAQTFGVAGEAPDPQEAL